MTSAIRRLCVLFPLLLVVACGSEDGFVEEEVAIPAALIRVVNSMSESSELLTRFGVQDLGVVNYGETIAFQTVIPRVDREVAITYFDGNQVIELISTTVNLEIQHARTIIIAGTLAEPMLIEIDQAPQDNSSTDADITIVHAASNHPDAYDFHLSQSSDPINEPLVTLSQFDVARSLRVVPGADYRLQVTEPGTTEVLWGSGQFGVDAQVTPLLVLLDNFGPGEVPVRILAVSNAGVVGFPEERLPGAVRVAQMVPDVGMLLDFFVDGNLLEEDADFQTVGDYNVIDSGDYQLTVTEADNPDNVVLEGVLDVTSGVYQTIATIGLLENITLAVSGDRRRRITDRSEFSVSAFSPEIPDPDVYLVPEGEDFSAQVPLLLTYGNTDSGPLETGQYDVFVTEPGSDDTNAGPFPVTLESGGIYRLFLSDQPGGGGPVVILPGDDLSSP